ncbi:MAG: hypothetical protein ACOCZH_00095 [Phototrophicaceae bacterium]
MSRLAAFAYALLMLLVVAACSSEGVPRVTPTVAPTDTPQTGTPIAELPSRTPFITVTSTDAPTVTSTATATTTATSAPTQTNTPDPSETATVTPSTTPTATPTLTRTPSRTPTPEPTNTRRPTPLPLPEQATITPTATLTSTPTATATATATDTNTPTATATDTPTATATPTASATATPPLPPTLSIDEIRGTVTARAVLTQTQVALSATPTPNLVLTETAIADAVFATRTALPLTQTAAAASPTPNPQDIALTETAIATVLTPPPTIAVSPTVITATPGGTTPVPTPPEDLGILPPEGGEPEEEFPPDADATAAVPTPTFAAPTVPPVLAPATLQSNWRELIVPRTTTNLGPQSFTLGEVIPLSLGNIGLGGGALPTLFATRPGEGPGYAQTSPTGQLFVETGGGPFIPPEPFSPFVGQVSSPDQNDYFVTAVSWSNDGRYLAFVVDGDRGGHPNPTAEDGVHYLDTATGAVRTVVRDCPFEGHPGCLLGGARDFFAQSTEVQWSPGGSRLLVRQQVADRDRGALLVVPLDQSDERQPPTLNFDYGSWTRDGRRLVVSGRSPENAVIIGIVDADGGNLQVIFNGSDNGIWVQHAAQQPDGDIVALGRPAAEQAVRIIDQDGRFLTGPIGSAAPDTVIWNSNRSAVSVVAGGQQFIAYVDGRVQEVSPGAEVPGGTAQQLVPSGVVEGSRFAPGQQVQINAEQLNVRQRPSVDSPLNGGFLVRGEYVRILAGPLEADGLAWWQVRTADGRAGWVAGTINGFDALVPAG